LERAGAKDLKMRWDDDNVDRMIGTLLRVGVLLAAAVVMASGIWFLLHFGTAVPDYRVFRSEPAGLRSVTGILLGAARGRPLYVIQFGLLVLIFTPILRVAFSVFAFARQRDRMYAGITLVVLGVLLGSLTGLVHVH
jgi:uncharacterized membrane protein